MSVCPECAADVGPEALCCPQCLRLTHGAELQNLASRAREAWRIGRFAEEKSLWEASLALLPPESTQSTAIRARLAELEQQFSAGGAPRDGSRWGATLGVGSFLLLLLSKGKVLLLGLTKLGTLATMAVSFGVYWSMFGWAFAGGLIGSIYIHEMGHIVAIRRYGLPATAPMFIPGLGAFIRLHGVRLPPIPDARIGLAGPLHGLGAALAAFALYLWTGARIWGAIAHFGAMINLFNLIPLWSLDGARGVRSMTRLQRGIVVAASIGLWMLTSNPMLFLISAAGAYRLFTRDWQSQPDQPGLAWFLLLLASLTFIVVKSPLQ